MCVLLLSIDRLLGQFSVIHCKIFYNRFHHNIHLSGVAGVRIKISYSVYAID